MHFALLQKLGQSSGLAWLMHLGGRENTPLGRKSSLQTLSGLSQVGQSGGTLVAEALPSPGVTPLGAGSAVRAAILSSEGPPGAGVDAGAGGYPPGSPQASEGADTPRLPQLPVISRFEVDAAGRPMLHGEQHCSCSGVKLNGPPLHGKRYQS